MSFEHSSTFFIWNSSTICRSLKTATDEDLYEVLERVRHEESETYYPAIPEIFASWAKTPGYPILNVEFFPNNRTVKVSQELFVPFINSTAPSSFYILYNYAASSNGVSGFVDTSATNWIHDESESRHALDNTKDDESWAIFNVQQTGEMRESVFEGGRAFESC
jgi:aminopeptidase N